MKSASREPRLRRDINLFEAVIYGIGLILGAGIYALIGKVVGIAGNASWMAFLLAAGIAILTGLSYAELASTFPKTAAEFNYVKEAYNKKVFSFTVGWVLLFSGFFSAATVSLGFAGYFIGLMGGSIIPVAIVLIILLSLVNFIGIEESAKLNIIFTFIEAAGIVLIIVLGFSNLGNISINFLEFPVGTTNILLTLMSSAALIFFAYIGFEQIANLSEETENPRKTIPRALILSIIVTTILYILMALAVVSSNIPNLELYPNPLSAIAETFLGPAGALIMSIIALFATANTALILLIVGSRIMYGMSVAGAFPKIFSKVHRRTRTPWVAIIFAMIVAIGLVFFGDIEIVARSSVFAIFLVFFIINVTLIYLRKSQPDLKRPFKVKPSIKWLPIFPLLGAITCFLMFFSFIENYWIFIIQLIIIAAGLGFYGILALIHHVRKKV